MRNCTRIAETAKWFDGEASSTDMAAHVMECACCAAHVATLETLRSGARALQEDAAISDAAFPNFLAGISVRIEEPKQRSRGLWAFASVATAALVVALSTFWFFTEGPEAVSATVVESYSTEIDNATIVSVESDDGGAMVWVNVEQGDMW